MEKRITIIKYNLPTNFYNYFQIREHYYINLEIIIIKICGQNYTKLYKFVSQ